MGGTTVRRTAFRLSATTGAALIVSALIAGPALSAGAGYGPSQSPPASALAAGFNTTITAQTLPATGGTVTGSADGSTCTVSIESGTFANGVEVVLSGAQPSSINAGSGTTVVADCSATFLDPNTGNPLSGPFSPSVTMTIV